MVKRKLFFIAIFLVFIWNLHAQDSMLIYSGGTLNYKIKNSKIDYITLENESGVKEDSLYLYKYGLISFKEALGKIDSLSIKHSELPTLDKAIAADKDFTLFYEALVATGLDEALTPYLDETYNLPTDLINLYEGIGNGIGGIVHVPTVRKFGFTALMESDETFAQLGITSLDELKTLAKQIYDEVYPNDSYITDVTDSRNSLNRFIAYHLIEKKLTESFFIEKYDNTGSTYDADGSTHSVKSQDMFEYIETMCPPNFIQVRTLRNDSENPYNNFNMVSTSDVVRLTKNVDNYALNGVYHEIDTILAYTPSVHDMIWSKRVRMDFASMFPELTNNDMRVGHETSDYNCISYKLPNRFIDRLRFNEEVSFEYINADDRFCDYQGDEFGFSYGMYEVSIETPAVPAGTYEIRVGLLLNGKRGVAQYYWDGVPCGLPLDLDVSSTDPSIGYVTPGTDKTDPYGYENDKVLRNHGFMKAPATFKAVSGFWQPNGAYTSARNNYNALRRNLIVITFITAETHRLQIKAVRAGEVMLDYIEFVPVTVLDKEDIY